MFYLNRLEAARAPYSTKSTSAPCRVAPVMDAVIPAPVIIPGGNFLQDESSQRGAFRLGVGVIRTYWKGYWQFLAPGVDNPGRRA